MEEDIGVKGTVTRLRRRLSVESDDPKSPATQSTPTKKRGGRLAAKPQLELIDENSSETPSKKTKKPAVKDLTEPVEDKPVTPARRSTRVRSNTSIVSGTPGEGAEDKPLTPARRSTRTRSNTSLISDAITNVDSPRAKRAARRNSQLGSDTDAPVTPARQTRRTRKDSASSIDTVEIPANKVVSQINEAISEEAENNDKEANNNDTTKNDSLSLRKSPRLKEKTKKKSIGTEEGKEREKISQDDSKLDIQSDHCDPELIETPNSVISTPLEDADETKAENTDLKQNISLSSANLIEKMDTSSKSSKSTLNKTTSIIEETNTTKGKRSRTKSWTTIAAPTHVESSFYSDNEGIKRKDKTKVKRHSDTLTLPNDQSKPNQDVSLQENANISKTEKKDGSKKSDVSNQHEKALETDCADESPNIKSDETKSKTERILEQTPTGIIQSLVYIDDSDSNTGSDKHEKIELLKGFDDQCVPVIEHIPDENSKQVNNYSCEPMDIDETIPNDITHIQPETAENLSSKASPDEKDVNKSLSKSKRKSSISNADSTNKTKNEDKSTLVLSQLKDVSLQECESINNVEITEQLSQSANPPNEKNLNIDKKNLSVNYSTSTPLQQKPGKRLGMPVNTSIITPTNKSSSDLKHNKVEAKVRSKNSTLNNDLSSSDDQDSDEESSKDKSNIIDDEAEEASANYESGDSRDDEERQYEEENAVKEKGETLNSDEDECSDDSDYEKGSFVVSSDMEDDDLLSGSGDDLSMSADELTMSAKSKKKFNDRKIKQQKKASREMFEARHRSKDSDKKGKSKKQMISSDSEEEEIDNKRGKGRRQRINSSHDESSIKPAQKKTHKLLSESESDNGVASEKEITICEDNQAKNDPLIIQEIIKTEPKTPQKSFNISTIEVIGREEIENVDVDKNMSQVIQPKESTDPLQSTILQNNSEDDEEFEEESLSENEEIKQNYDSMLKDLNKTETRKIKKIDISLNLTKKSKQKVKEPVIDELNLTQVKTKKSKVTKLPSIDQSENSEKRQYVVSISNDKEDSSDSIDMKLLFPEDSNDVDNFNAEEENKSTLNKINPEPNTLNDLDGNVNFFIDTTGTHTEETQNEDNFIGSGKKKKNLNNSLQKNNVSIIDNEVASQEETQLDVSTKTTIKKKKNSESTADINDSSANHGTNKIKNTSFSINEDVEDLKEDELSISNKSKNKNKKKNSLSEDTVGAEPTNENDSVTALEENSVNKMHSAKKNKNKNNTSMEKVNEIVNVSNSENDNNKSSQNINVEVDGNSTKKKKNKKNSGVMNIEENSVIDSVQDDLSISTASTDGKKKKKRSSESLIIDVASDDQPECTVNSEKKKKNKKSLDNSQILNSTKNTTIVSEGAEPTPSEKTKTPKKDKSQLNSSVSQPKLDEIDVVDATTSTSSADKKKKKRTSESQETEIIPITTEAQPTLKRKRKSSGNKDLVEILVPEEKESAKLTNESISEGTKKKKRKISQNDKESPTNPVTTEEQQEVVKKSKKKKNKHVPEGNDEDESPVEMPVSREADEVFGQTNTENTKIKKRKRRDGDDNNNKSNKVLKQNSMDKVYVPRLPEEILKQLDDKPKEVEAKKVKVVSTTSFVVENTAKRKNKPSNYLEQSVYLNEEEAEEEKTKLSTIKAKPKVLPFLPTVSTSDQGFTTTFRVNVVPTETKFVAQINNVRNFKNSYLGKKVKKLGTYEKYKRQVTAKLHKF